MLLLELLALHANGSGLGVRTLLKLAPTVVAFDYLEGALAVATQLVTLRELLERVSAIAFGTSKQRNCFGLSEAAGHGQNVSRWLDTNFRRNTRLRVWTHKLIF